MVSSRLVMPQIFPTPPPKLAPLQKLKRPFGGNKNNHYHFQKIRPPKNYLKSLRNSLLNLPKKLLKFLLSVTVIKNPIRKILKIVGGQIFKLLLQIAKLINQQVFEPSTQVIRDYFLSFFYSFHGYKSIILSSLLIATGVFASTNMLYAQVFQNLANPEELVLKDPRVTTRIVDRNGEVLFRLYEDENRTLIPLSAMPLSIIQATIAIEDKDFYNHHGFSIRGITRALKTNFSKNSQSVQGGSTLTQQLVKNRLLTPEKSYSRKLKELILAIMVEDRFSKEEILEMYLNQVAYGGTTYGIEEASMQYFGKHAKQLTLAESALIAGLTKAPSVYSPFANPEMAKDRQKEVLRRMVEDGYISQKTADKALAEELHFRQEKTDIKAPHFVMYVKKLLSEQYDKDMLQGGGLIIQTSLDLKLQNEVQEIVSQEIDRLHRLNINNGASLVTNPQTGEILAMVGSTNYFDFSNDGQVNVTTSLRQPGSSIKPLTYALGLENGLLPNTKINDRPVTFNVVGSEPYQPRNYDGKFHGQVTAREALASSYNIPAVKLLALLGVDKLIQKGKQMGITTWDDENRFGLSLTLGGGEVLMTDMATMYGVFANQGYRVDLNPILKITDYRGSEIYYNHCALDHQDCEKTVALDPGAAYIISNILSDNNARTPAFGPMSELAIPNQEVAVKTGTTNSLRDNWTIGYTSDRVVAVWVGNNDNSAMSYVASGITGASPIWNSIMRKQLDADNPHHFLIPSNVTSLPICLSTNSPACNWCQQTRTEFFLENNQPQTYCRTWTATTSAQINTNNYFDLDWRKNHFNDKTTQSGLKLID